MYIVVSKKAGRDLLDLPLSKGESYIRKLTVYSPCHWQSQPDLNFAKLIFIVITFSWYDDLTSLKAGQTTGEILFLGVLQVGIWGNRSGGDNLLKQKAFGCKLNCLGIGRTNTRQFFQFVHNGRATTKWNSPQQATGHLNKVYLSIKRCKQRGIHPKRE
jgi:hypothetical protein